MSAASDLRYTESVDRVGTPSRLTGPTYVRTNERTYEEPFSPTMDQETFVTRTPAYGFSPDLIRARAKLILETLTPTNPVTILAALPPDPDAARHWAELAGDLCTVTGCNALAEDGWCLAHYPDEVAIQRAMKGERIKLLAHEREEVIRRLERQGLTSAQISERAHVNRKAIIRVMAS